MKNFYDSLSGKERLGLVIYLSSIIYFFYQSLTDFVDNGFNGFAVGTLGFAIYFLGTVLSHENLEKKIVVNYCLIYLSLQTI